MPDCLGPRPLRPQLCSCRAAQSVDPQSGPMALAASWVRGRLRLLLRLWCIRDQGDLFVFLRAGTGSATASLALALAVFLGLGPLLGSATASTALALALAAFGLAEAVGAPRLGSSFGATSTSRISLIAFLPPLLALLAASIPPASPSPTAADPAPRSAAAAAGRAFLEPRAAGTGGADVSGAGASAGPSVSTPRLGEVRGWG